MPIITPNTRGHYPAGYPRGGSGGSSSGYDVRELEQATDRPDLQVFKTALEDAQSDASSYFRRNQNAWDWWHARWPGQTVDGRKWNDRRTGAEAWPWEGASDVTVRTTEKVIGQHRTLMTFALRNMKPQAKAMRPAAGSQGKESEQATMLLNWMLFTHMGADLHRELRLAVNWRNGYGACALCLDWEQERQLDYIDVNVAGLQEFINEPAVREFVGDGGMEYGSGGVMGQIPIGENLTIMDLQEMIMDPAYADDLAGLLKAVSHDYLTLKGARAKLDALRELRTVEIPIPYVFKSQPRLVALRPMVDLVFPAGTDDFQRAPFTDRVEYVSGVTLRDRIETAQYSRKFVEEALERRGPSSGTNGTWLTRTAYDREGAPNEFENDIELHHFQSLVHDRGVPVRFDTVFHMDIEEPAKHGPCGYDHGQSCYHPMRFEIESRPILSSRGIGEVAYSWEQTLKRQLDGQSDRADMALRPVIFTTNYAEMQKLKASYMPSAILPIQRFGTLEKDKPPMWDPSSIQLIDRVEQMVEEHYAIFGQKVDPELKQLRREEMVDDLLAELKPVKQQMMKLIRQLIPDAEVAEVVGPLSRPFHISRAELQGEFEITATVDLRDIDREWAKERFALVPQIFATDTQGQINRTPIIKTMLGWLGYDLAESALPDDKQQVTEAEVQAEKKALREIIASGADVELPKGANAQLRLQTGQGYLQELMQTNPVVQRRLQENPEIMKIIQNRAKAFGFQLQQIENAQIGRLGTTETFSKQAPALAEAGPAGGG